MACIISGPKQLKCFLLCSLVILRPFFIFISEGALARNLIEESLRKRNLLSRIYDLLLALLKR